MSMRAKCVVCDAPVANPYAPDTHCERCKNPCPTCGGMVQYCTHPLRDVGAIVERDLRMTLDLQDKRRRAA